ncbi:bifunctional metallophosphatase/5'-nucleotidase [Allobacillus halotolerans]|uniref:Bifunctional metallophosphatase/5'-nucleotidase n=1 Tax=Allobacillus halotolerans TaxID=570278 RepID=A0ABS6GNF5_9BACI|nr:bifunctional UDP-sugar hydrolase/5'-nucleotidase [Allobacillus halotolerans]MBU6080411.1 bifunctional metallophosphatase/5'-nucleotidase [Allobacillus halotolerans]
MRENIHLYFTSDLHSHFENWPKIIHSMKHEMSKHADEFHLILDNGDHLDRSHFYTEATLGEANIRLLNEADYHVVTLGNNEGITLPEEQLYHLYDDADFSVTCANIAPINQDKPDWLKPYEVFESDQGTKIGVIGLTAPFQLFYEQLGWTTYEPIEMLEQYMPELEERCDIIVLLSHLGVYQDELIAEKFPIDVIIGGHTHHLFNQGQVHDGTLLNAVGKHGFYFGKVHLVYDHQKKQVIQSEGTAVEIGDEQDEETKALIENIHQEAEEVLGKTVVVLDENYPANWYEETELMNNFVDELQTWTNADCAMLNAGVLLHGFSAGEVTRKDIHSSCPHPMNPCVMEMTGKELLETVRMFEGKEFIEFELKGLGFRGKRIGKMIYSNLTAQVHPKTDFVEKIWLDEEEVEPNRAYQVATADTFSFPSLVPTIASVKEKHYFMPEFIRDVLEKSVTKL